ncbi:unnamed protein product [Mytilus coruscus]|uniref:Uncharacterized protein n=1 Tax=Mytilus coruscus TaxID=42192 RepID=A0A6J8AUX6_MYTCO|nr:unnamed protein product [Mytilus coruscus]
MSMETGESLLDFYEYLYQKIGSEEVVRTRRLTSVIRDIWSRNEIITSGSKGERLNLKGSDVDIMAIDHQFKVNPSEREFIECRKFTLIMNTEETQPCFSQLYLLTHYGNHTLTHVQVSKRFFNMLQQKHPGYVLPSEQYQLNNLSPYVLLMIDPKIHGPCISDRNETVDIA